MRHVLNKIIFLLNRVASSELHSVKLKTKSNINKKILRSIVHMKNSVD